MKHITPSFLHTLYLLLLCAGCGGRSVNPPRIISLYDNATFHKVRVEDPLRIGVTRHIAKVHNKHGKPIVIPIDFCHKWGVEKIYVAEIGLDSLVDIAGNTTFFQIDLGVDTLYPGETQRYFVDLHILQHPLGPGSYAIIEFQYFFLEDFSTNPYDYRFRQNEYFILYRDSTDSLHIHDTAPGFNPEIHVSHPLPKLRQ